MNDIEQVKIILFENNKKRKSPVINALKNVENLFDEKTTVNEDLQTVLIPTKIRIQLLSSIENTSKIISNFQTPTREIKTQTYSTTFMGPTQLII